MTETYVDRTREVEARLKAIRVYSEDSCVFFQQRSGCVMSHKACIFCKFGAFSMEDEDKNKQGLCKFKARWTSN